MEMARLVLSLLMELHITSIIGLRKMVDERAYEASRLARIIVMSFYQAKRVSFVSVSGCVVPGPLAEALPPH
jgi:hypothetical protein